MDVVIRPHGRRSAKPVSQKEARYTFDELAEFQSKDLNFKIDWAKARIEGALEILRTPAIAFSAGKDSTVLLHLLRKFNPKVITIYGNTTIEFPECLKFARWLKDEWDLVYYEAKPDVTFWDIIDQYGWPLLGKSFGVGGVAHKSSRAKFFEELAAQGNLDGDYAIQAKIPISSACCSFLKERPSARLQRQLGVDGVFLGILASESRQRMFNFLRYGEWYKPNDQVWKCHPLAIWNDDDIWDYIHKFNIPYAQLYDMGFHDGAGNWIAHKRNGCMFCGMDIRFPNNHLAIMRRTHPKAWETIMVKKGLGKVLIDLKLELGQQYDMFEMLNEEFDVKKCIERLPCIFDQI